MGNCLQSEAVAASPPPYSRKGETVLAPKTKTNCRSKEPAESASTSKTSTSIKTSLHEKISIAENPADRDIWDYYEKVKHVAQGSTCDIWTTRKKNKTTGDDTVYAVKIISKAEMNSLFLQEMRNEIAILRRLDHPNVIRVYEMYESSRFIYLVVEYLEGGDLYSEPLPYSEAATAKVLTKILSAVAYLHEERVVHRDLKMENVMYDQVWGEPKLIDFGLSKQHVGGKMRMHGKVGTLVTMSPEVLRGDYTAKADIWSVGVIAYILLSGKYPFNGNTEKEIASGIVEGKYQMDSKEWTYVSQPAKDFVSSLLTYDPDKRPTASQALASPWLRKTFSLKDRRPPNEVMNSVKNALVQSAKASNFKKLVAMLIAHKRSNEAIKELREAFDAIDTNNHGTITYWEFRSALKDCNFSDEELKSMFRGIDVNESGVINYTEFLAMTLESRGRIEEDEIMQAFDRIDADRSGFISKENLCDILDAKCSAENCDAMVQEILDELDSDRDGQISYEEFLEMFREKHREELDKECCQLEEALPKTKYGCS